MASKPPGRPFIASPLHYLCCPFINIYRWGHRIVGLLLSLNYYKTRVTTRMNWTAFLLLLLGLCWQVCAAPIPGRSLTHSPLNLTTRLTNYSPFAPPRATQALTPICRAITPEPEFRDIRTISYPRHPIPSEKPQSRIL